MSENPTHRHVARPAMSARHLADYMAASDVAQRRIARDCNFLPIARLPQHDEAMTAVAKYLRDGSENPGVLMAKAQELRNRATDDDFWRSTWDIDAAFIERFVEISAGVVLPKAELAISGPALAMPLGGVKVTANLRFRLRRTDRQANLKIGGAMIRYAKGRSLSEEVSAWQSALLFGMLTEVEAARNGNA